MTIRLRAIQSRAVLAKHTGPACGSALALLSVLGMFAILAGCSDNSQTVQTANLTAGAGENALAAAISGSELTLLRAGGVDVLDGRGVFSIGWRQLFDPRFETANTVGRAMAVGLDGNTEQGSAMTGTGTHRAGVDMGSVYLNYSGNHLELIKHTGPDGGTMYASSFGPHDGSGNIGFVPGGTYQFQVTGSDKFSSLQTEITAPDALIGITSPVKGDSVSASGDLTIMWTGGKVGVGVLIAVAALPPPPQAHAGYSSGDRQPMLDSTRSIIVKLNDNPGSYTVPVSKLQDLISRMSALRMAAGALMCTVSQMSDTEVTHDGGTVHVVFRNGDGVMVRLK